MSRRNAKLYIDDIIASIDRIEEYIKGIGFEEFVRDQKTIDAVVRNLLVIGEAAKNMPDETRRKHPDLPWFEIIGMRNKVIHEYFGVKEDVLWKTIKDDLPEFKNQIKSLL